LDHTKKLLVLAFRGTVSENDGNTDFSFFFTRIEDVCSGCQAHKGFWGYWSSIADQVITQLHSATEKHKDYDLAVVGHSLGGAVAALAGTVLRQKGFDLDIVSAAQWSSTEYLTSGQTVDVWRPKSRKP
jgi:pimeloyl-ACP methyl ester carboxylesterase